MSKRWILTGQKGYQTSLKYEENVQLPEKLGDNDVLVELKAASINQRELVIANVEVLFGRPDEMANTS